MGTLRNITRRTFLIGSVAVGGGVAFGTYMVAKPGANPLLDDLPEGAAALTPYVKIDAEGITLITPRADKGQGAYAVQALLLAEELDVELDQIRVDPGMPSATYWNTGLGAESAEFLEASAGIPAAVGAGLVNSAMKLMGLQITGGSTTVPDGFDKLRAAGAAARETLKAAAAQEAGVAIKDLRTARGAVILPDGQTRPYTELAAQAAALPVVRNVELRDPSQWRLIGKPTQRIDIAAKSTGTLTYGIDFAVDGMVHAAIKLNPAQTGDLIRFDAAGALEIPGVTDVVPVPGGVVVLANNTWTAFQGAEAVQAEWGAAPFPAQMAAHWQALSDAFTGDSFDSRARDDGDMAQALQNGTAIDTEYRAPYLAHAPLEPISAIVRVNDDSVDVWTGTQIPRFVQTNVARIVGMEPEQVRVHVLYMGGSFGHRLEDEVVKQATHAALHVKGTAVKLTYSREEDMMHDFTRQIAMARARGTVRDGKVTAYDLGIAMPSVVASQMARQGQVVPGPDSQIVAGAFEQPFAFETAHRVTGYRAPALAPLSSWRSVGASTNGFFYNAGLDELIHAAGADPLAERLRLCTDPLSQKVLEAVAEMASWDGAMGEGRGRGIAFTKSFGVRCAEVIEVSQTDAGLRVDNVWVAAEVGTIVDPINFENHVQGGVVWALGHAMNCEITYTDGVADQTNYHAYEGMRMYQTPQIHVRGLENGEAVHGIGEPMVPPAAAALASAIFAATGTRLREMPFNKFVDFV